MKQYVAKWRPVGGQITQGDYYQCGNEVILQRSGPVDMKKISNNVTKVTLFLCEPKIEVGAPAQWSALDEWKAITEVNIAEEYIVLEGDHEKIYIDDCTFKYYELIGEISPDAYAYVQDGYKFHESEVEKYWQVGGQGSETWNLIKASLLEGLDEMLDAYFVYKIKGPCGHFH